MKTLLRQWYHRDNGEKVDGVAKVDNNPQVAKVEKEPPNKTIKVTETNRKRINRLAGTLNEDGEIHSQNDAISHLFVCKEQLEAIKKREKEHES